MKKYILNSPILSSFLIFFFCLSIRMIEYFIIKTDETLISENFIHKIIGIVLLFILLRVVNFKLSDIGFKKNNCFKY